MSLFDLSGKVALITGSTKGIGKAIAIAMAQAGAKVVISSRKQEQCDEVADEISAMGHEVLPVACNVSHRDQIEGLVASVMEKWGRVDSLVCNAAVNPYFGDFLDTPDDAFDKIINVNIRSNMILARAVIDQMIERRDGSITLVSSNTAFKGSEKLGVYALTKAADIQMARNLAIAYGRHNIRANTIVPAVVRTEFSRVLWEDPERLAAVEASYALGRIGEPEDIAGAAVYLASRAGAWMTGQTMILDGGWSVVGDPPSK